MTVTKTFGKRFWNAGVLSSESTNSYSVKLNNKNDGNTMIGFSTKKFNPNGTNYMRHGWYLSVCNGVLFSQNDNWGRKYTNPINEDDVVTVIFDLKQSQISYLINQKNLGIAFKNVNESELYPAVELFNEGAKITFV